MTDTLEQKLRHHFNDRTADLPEVGPGVPEISDLRLAVSETYTRRNLGVLLTAAAAVFVIVVGGLVVLAGRTSDGDVSTADADRENTPSAQPDSQTALQPGATLPNSPDLSSAPVTAAAAEPTDWYRLAPDLDVSWYLDPGGNSPSMFCWRTPFEPDGVCSVDAVGTTVVPLVVPTVGNQTLVLAVGERSNPVLEVTLDDGRTLSAPQDFDDEIDWGVARFEVPVNRTIVLVAGVEPADTTAGDHPDVRTRAQPG